jgi:hypothetical protein
MTMMKDNESSEADVMRKVMKSQMRLGEVDVSGVALDIKSRDDIPRVLMGIKAVYMDPESRREVFDIPRTAVPAGVDAGNGRPGMDLWKIFILGSVRLGCDMDYDRLQEMANKHKTIRKMMGLAWEDDEVHFNLKTIKENVPLLTPEVLERINEVVVRAGHRLIGKKKEEDGALRCRVDSFVVKTGVHFPTDVNLLFDAARKAMELTRDLAELTGAAGWRQGEHLIGKLKKQLRRIENFKKRETKSEKRKVKREKELGKRYRAYLGDALAVVKRAKETLAALPDAARLENKLLIGEIEKYAARAERQADQTRRGVFGGEKIPHGEKVFSIFEPHTEMIIKGKAGVAFELGLNVCVVEDQHGFIPRHRVMEGEGDVDVAAPLMRETKARFPEITSVSCDRGFYSPENRMELLRIIDKVVMPRKGRAAPEESGGEFIAARRAHSGVESAINALGHGGLDLCPDSGIDGFKRYVALAVVAYNLHTLGAMFFKKENRRARRIAKYNATRGANRRKSA